jgi:molybdopterin synthase catalytic subunit
MEISVRLSTGLAHTTGSARLRVTLEEKATVGDLIQKLNKEYPSIAEQLDTTVAVVSGRHVELTEPLSEGQEVALLVPISGGCR